MIKTMASIGTKNYTATDSLVLKGVGFFITSTAQPMLAKVRSTIERWRAVEVFSLNIQPSIQPYNLKNNLSILFAWLYSTYNLLSPTL
jgi:hypothetical protein